MLHLFIVNFKHRRHRIHTRTNFITSVPFKQAAACREYRLRVVRSDGEKFSQLHDVGTIALALALQKHRSQGITNLRTSSGAMGG